MSPARRQDICHFFHLPRVIRNKIYTYALTDSTGLRVCEDRDSIGRLLSVTANDAHEPILRKVSFRDDTNQLKFVNRQLNLETSGLKLMYNDLYFDHVIDAACFLRVLSPPKIRHLSVLHIANRLRYPWNAWEEATAMIIQFWRKHPHISVHFSIDGRLEDHPLTSIALLRHHFRGESVTYGTIPTYPFDTSQHTRIFTALCKINALPLPTENVDQETVALLPGNFRLYLVPPREAPVVTVRFYDQNAGALEVQNWKFRIFFAVTGEAEVFKAVSEGSLQCEKTCVKFLEHGI